MPRSTSTNSTGVLSLRELQAKYEAVLAENERLYHDLRAEHAQRERYESAYRRVHEDAQKDQEILRQLYATISPAADTNQEAQAHDGGVFLRQHAGTNAQSSSSATAVASRDCDRIRSLERDCTYLQAKVESLHLALRRYEQSNDATGAMDVPLSMPSPPPHNIFPLGERDTPAAPSAGSDALLAEREGRRRAEEQLMRCHATLRNLHDDQARKECFYHLQLTALQQQNAALLEDLDMWVTREQQTYLENTFGSRLGANAKQEVPVSSSPAPARSAAKAADDECDRTVHENEALQLQQVQQCLKDQEELLALKDRSIEQLETRLRELEMRLAKAEVHPERPSVLASPPFPIAAPSKDLLQLRREAAAVEAAVKRFANTHLPEAEVLSPSSLHVAINDSASDEYSSETIVRDVSRVLRCVLEVVSHQSHLPVLPLYPQHEPAAALRTPPIAVAQPAAASSPYHSGETLYEAAQQVATLMRRHLQQ
ncbi:hypothetical protein ABL78_4389 [Leptomonas seymouri]|uniref:Uncharacterized protein n=1 Tax=Leptomonas seymouri TaxID=5684 RepID=A0A0N0P5K2_LEPSE|nr:hypothetical protein ABL78_4389 [Leptomonas seymouri]|eukprot:KPI86566.1 hypothetical protein ABL78_4389 [Leptomonas seymouri]